jgi:hypothetical protein
MIEVALAMASGCDLRPHRRVHSWAALVIGSKGRRIGLGTSEG